VNAGTYVLDPIAVAGVASDRPVSIEREVFPELIAGGRAVSGFVSGAYWMDLGTPEKYLRATFDALDGRIAGLSYEAPWVDPSAVVSLRAQLGRWVVVGPGGRIAEQARSRTRCCWRTPGSRRAPGCGTRSWAPALGWSRRCRHRSGAGRGCHRASRFGLGGRRVPPAPCSRPDPPGVSRSARRAPGPLPVPVRSRGVEPEVQDEAEGDRQADPLAEAEPVPGHQRHGRSGRQSSGTSLFRIAVRSDDHVVAVAGLGEEFQQGGQLGGVVRLRGGGR